jgi:hypothetical protein
VAHLPAQRRPEDRPHAAPWCEHVFGIADHLDTEGMVVALED